MTLITKITNNEISLSNLSQTELSRNFIKFSPKILKDFFEDMEIPFELMIKLDDKKFRTLFGTQNRLFFKKKDLKLSDNVKYRIKIEDSKLVKLSIIS